MSAHTAALQQLYVAYFSRPADPGGLAFWEGVMAAPGATIARVSTEFALQPEYTNEYAGLDAYGIVNRVYHNLFGRGADDAGLRFWGDQLAAKPAMISQIVLAIAGGGNNADGSRNADGVAFDNKVLAATAYADAVKADPLLQQAANHPAVIDSTRTFLAAVTSTASLNAALDPGTLHTTLATMAQTATAGGVAQAVTTAGAAVSVGADGQTSGPIWVTHSAQGGAAIAIDGGSSVTVSSSGATAGSSIVIGAHKGATGAVSVASAYVDGVGTYSEWASSKHWLTKLADITVTGGTSISVTQTAASATAATDTANTDVKLGAVTITGGTTTTAVTSVQSFTLLTSSRAAVTAVAGAETAGVKFGALKAGEALTLDFDADGVADDGELTFTAARNLTAPEVAAAFSGLSSDGTHGNGPAKDGVYTGHAGTWTSAAASGDTVVFTSTTYDAVRQFWMPYSVVENVTNLAFALGNASGTSVAPIVTTSDGVASARAVTGRLGVQNGPVAIDDNGVAASITSVAVDGYGAGSSIGAINSLTKLANLSLAHSGHYSNSADMVVDAAGIASLKLSVNDVYGGLNLDAGGASVRTLYLTATGADSAVYLTADALETLVVGGDKVAALELDLIGGHPGAELSGLRTVTVTGSAGLRLGTSNADSIASIDTRGTTGSVTATIEGGRATYNGGAGQDMVTLATDTVVTKSIDLGAGDDSLSFDQLGVTGAIAAVRGGTGTDTLSMSATTAAALDDSTAFASRFTSFERLALNDVPAGQTIDLAKLGGFNYVTTGGRSGYGDYPPLPEDSKNPLTLNNLPSGGTVAMEGVSAGHHLLTVGVSNAATGTADVLNVRISAMLSMDASTNWPNLVAELGSLTAPNVETINLTAPFTGILDPYSYRFALIAADATSVNITGDNKLALALDGSTKVTSIDASSMTGDLIAHAQNAASAATLKGGSGNDELFAGPGHTADVLIGGAGDDALHGNDLSTFTGGAGADVFWIGSASTNANSYATITDFAAGEMIKIAGATAFVPDKVTQDAATGLQDYANAAMRTAAAGEMRWFQFDGNTYVAIDGAATNSSTFIGGEDSIVKLTGVVDLSNAAFHPQDATSWSSFAIV